LRVFGGEKGREGKRTRSKRTKLGGAVESQVLRLAPVMYRCDDVVKARFMEVGDQKLKSK
jgi:hypothetical protein